MKIDITSGFTLLSRKIKLCLMLSSFFMLMGYGPVIAGPEHLKKGLLMETQQLKSSLNSNLVILDTRSSWRFFLGHIPGALNLEHWSHFTVTVNGVKGLLNESKPFILKELKALGIDHSKTIVIYGDSKDKWRTDGRFFWMLERFGFKNVALLNGGWDQWIEDGGPVERGKSNTPKASNLKLEDIHFDDSTVADQQWIQTRLKSPSLVLIDNRELKEFQGDTPFGSPRGGRIPSAIHIDWRDFFDSRGKMKSEHILLNLLKGHNISKDKEIVVYCTGGVRSAMAYFVLRLLGFNVRNYDGSWWDWSQNQSLPLEI